MAAFQILRIANNNPCDIVRKFVNSNYSNIDKNIASELVKQFFVDAEFLWHQDDIKYVGGIYVLTTDNHAYYVCMS